MNILNHQLSLRISLYILVILALVGCQTETTGAAKPDQGPETAQASDTVGRLTPVECSTDIVTVAMRGQPACYMLSVWEDRAAASGRQIQLHIAVLPAVSRNKAPDALFFIPGGPGEAASESYAVLANGFEDINQKRDIVLVDQRGTGLSHALECAFDETETGDSDEIAPPFRQCLQQLEQNADLRFYTTAIAMDDLDQVRQALGYERINLYGASYGTRAALAYMRQYPQHVRTAMLDGVAPIGWPLGLDAPQDAQRAIDLQFERCSKQTECAAAFPNVAQEFEELLKRLDQTGTREVKLNHPISGEPTTVSLDRDSFANLVHMLSYSPETTALLPLLIHTTFTDDDFQRFAAVTLSTEGVLTESISVGMRMSVVCAEDEPLLSQQPATPGYLGDFAMRVFKEVCAFWPRGVIPAEFSQPVRSDAPTLLISGEYDPVTPPENAQQAAQTLPNSLQITVPGMGHVNVTRGCLPNLATKFIETASTTSLDTTCVQSIRPMPFFINFNGPTP